MSVLEVRSVYHAFGSHIEPQRNRNDWRVFTEQEAQAIVAYERKLLLGKHAKGSIPTPVARCRLDCARHPTRSIHGCCNRTRRDYAFVN